MPLIFISGFETFGCLFGLASDSSSSNVAGPPEMPQCPAQDRG